MNWTFGADLTSEKRAEFRIWYTLGRSLDLVLLDSNARIELIPDKSGMARVEVEAKDGLRYAYSIGGRLYPDPGSRFQPEGIGGPSQLVDHSAYQWRNIRHKGRDLSDYIIYELHVGTFTEMGSFAGVEQKAEYLMDLGVTAIELMPVNQFPGHRNWGYDGVFPYAPQNTYGSVGELKSLVDVIHSFGMDVILDVVYNHLGPEGNYLPQYAPFFTDTYTTPWGKALNYDGPYSDMVRRYFVENALYWLTEFRVDALRLDAIHGIFDFSPYHILSEIRESSDELAERTGRIINIIAESDLNDPVIIRDKKDCGYGLSGQWNDDFHHAVHAFVTGERKGYYSDFGEFSMIEKALKDGFVYDGTYSDYRKRTRGAPLGSIPLQKLIVYSQNHDQIGNRADAERLISLVTPERTKSVAALVLLSAFTPLIFMGEEYGETSPFNYFIDTHDADLARAVRKGRRREFKRFGEDYGKDPNDPVLFNNSKLDWARSGSENGKKILSYYAELIRIRKSIGKERMARFKLKTHTGNVIHFEYGGDRETDVIVSLSDTREEMPLRPGDGHRILLSSTWYEFDGMAHRRAALTQWLEPFETIVAER